MPKIVLGTDYFPDFVKDDAFFVDKSLLIKQVIEDGAKSILITRPRRWGKSLDLSMLQHFFAASVNGLPTEGLFEKLAIASADEGHYMQFQGQFPVIFLNLKDIEERTYDGAIERLHGAIAEAYSQFPELQNSDKLLPNLRRDYDQILMGNANASTMKNALKRLSQCLYTHYHKPVYILVDEYDKPLNFAYHYDYFDQLSEFMKSLLSAGLKSNPCLAKGIMTGILRLSKANMLSGLNNLKEYTLLDDTYAGYFGFTEEEVTYTFEANGLAHDLDKVKAWYNGYNVDNTIIYNPWSIMNCVDNKGVLRPYWVDTADNSFIKEILLNASSEIKNSIKALLEGKSITVVVVRHVTFDHLRTDPSALWSLLLFAGYLRIDSRDVEYDYGQLNCQLSIPNQEIMSLFYGIFTLWFAYQSKRMVYSTEHLDCLLAEDVAGFTRALKHYLMNASFHDTRENAEMFYHGFVLATVIPLKPTHHVFSNRESGQGRYDVAIIPHHAEHGDLGILLEFKRVKDTEQLDVAARAALQQINDKHYDYDVMQQPHIKKILRIGMAFSGKAVTSAYQYVDCQQKVVSDIVIG
jgi:hypothetical protein